MKKIRIFNKLISLVVLASLITSTLYGCSSKGNGLENVNLNVSTNNIDTEALVEAVVANIEDDIQEDALTLSFDVEDYEGDAEALVYGLLQREFGFGYDVFTAYADLPNGETVCGIAYTDYSEYYANDDESEVYFMTGLLPFYGELNVSDEDFNSGLLLHDMNFESEGTSFVWKYKSSMFMEHCVYSNQYIQYGVDDNGIITYSKEDYSDGIYDESIGSLYSYDEKRYLYDVDGGESVPLKGEALSMEIDYDALEDEINNIIAEQNSLFSNMDIQFELYFAKEAVTNYLLSMQEETFLGYNVDELVELSKNIDTSEFIQLSPDGIEIINIEDMPGSGASALTKWIVGTTCVIAVGVGMVASYVGKTCPALSAAGGALAGVGIEIFMQVVVDNNSLDDINWRKVAIAAVSGAISGLIGPYVKATFDPNTFRYEFVDSLLDGIVGGIEYSVNAWLDGEQGKVILQSFGEGLAIGFGMSAAFKSLGKGLGKIADDIAPDVSKFTQRIKPKTNSKIAKLTATISNAVSGVADKLNKLEKRLDDPNNIFRSKYVSDRFSARAKAYAFYKEERARWLKESVDTLENDGTYYDMSGKLVTKKDLYQIATDAKDGKTVFYVVIDGKKVEYKKINGVVSQIYDSNEYPTVTLKNAMTNVRDANYDMASEEFIKMWKKDRGSIPESILADLKANNWDIDTIEAEDLSKIIKSNSEWVYHENIDLKTITLVETKIHTPGKGGINHFGGRALADRLKAEQGKKMIDALDGFHFGENGYLDNLIPAA